MKIVIPSLGRAGTAASMKWLPASGRQIVFAIHHDEYESYKKAYPHVEFFLVREEYRHHTGLIRKQILNEIRVPFIFVDDDIRISLKSVVDIQAVFDVLEVHILKGASMAGLGQQLFSNAQIEKCELINGDLFAVPNKFVATVYAINPLHFDTCPLEELPVYEDVALCIHAIQRGGTITSYVATHSNVSPPSGGCNSWRNKEITITSLNKLVELYPDVCSIRPTDNTTHNQYIGIGLRTAWSKIKKLS